MLPPLAEATAVAPEPLPPEMVIVGAEYPVPPAVTLIERIEPPKVTGEAVTPEPPVCETFTTGVI